MNLQQEIIDSMINALTDMKKSKSIPIYSAKNLFLEILIVE